MCDKHPGCLCSTPFPTRAEQELADLAERDKAREALKNGDETFEDVFDVIYGEALDLLIERQRKYGPNNVRTLGLYGIFTRIEDKMERLRRAFEGTMVAGHFDVREVNRTADESLDDADIDAANYHLIRVALRRGLWGRPLAEEANA